MLDLQLLTLQYMFFTGSEIWREIFAVHADFCGTYDLISKHISGKLKYSKSQLFM